MQDTTQQQDALSPPAPLNAEELEQLVINCLEDVKAEDIIHINLKGKTSIADSMFIATGRSTRQVAAIADHLYRNLKHVIGGGCKLEGMEKADWVLIDAGNIIIHVFRPEVRSFYNLEKMWTADFTPDKMTETPESSED